MISDIVKCAVPLAPGSKLLILGGGYCGSHLKDLAKALGSNVLCSRRKPNSAGADFAFDSLNRVLPSDNDLDGVSHIVSSIPPTNDGHDPVLNSLKNQLLKLPLQWVGYLSTTGVYGDCNGNWVNEEDPTNPIQPRSKRRLSCEKAWQSSGLPVQILRLPGIYGQGRSAIDSLKTGKSKIIEKVNQVFSRIHVDDIAGAIFHLIHLSNKGNHPKIVNLTDNLPSNNAEVIRYAAKLLKCKLPPIESYKLACKTMSPMALSFWQENRRVSNYLLCKKLGYSLIHPDYKSGLKDCLLKYK